MPVEPTHPYTVIDVFTDRPLAGNPLAVFTAGEAVPSRLMLAAARELHLSETVFVLPGDDLADATLRIFTPHAELPFAGHPVLGAAFVVGELNNFTTVRLRTGAGIIPVTLTREHGEIVYGEMEQPLPTVRAFERESELLEALGVSRPVLPLEIYRNGPTHVMVGLADAEQLAAAEPDMVALARLGPIGIDCFAALEPDAGPGEHTRAKCRVFCPGMGIPEDPATGSAAGPLALHLARHGWYTPGRTLSIIQGVEIQRPSALIVRVDGSPEDPTRIAVGGRAVPVARGHFRLQ
ncbi:MAG TPA: PhzF family phenazine biosynthesis protein [Solirubrobacteraceae bacterium]|jgi:trans-2,3-dihydro-3-hydroxyanthranilate isomerase|nr:PhzF family phenazine biosynthesis protein [Solirubrobacteraceae bacterium]